MYPVNFNGGNPLPPTTLARVAGYSLESVDKVMDEINKVLNREQQ